jgi:hypothetical protein
MSHRGRRNSFLITFTAGLFATSVSSFGADPVTGYSTAIAVPSQAVPGARRPIPAHPIDSLPIPTWIALCNAPEPPTGFTRR